MTFAIDSSENVTYFTCYKIILKCMHKNFNKARKLNTLIVKTTPLQSQYFIHI